MKVSGRVFFPLCFFLGGWLSRWHTTVLERCSCLTKLSTCQRPTPNPPKKKLDKALKRNSGGNQQPQQTVVSPKTTSTDLPADEPISETDETEPIEE